MPAWPEVRRTDAVMSDGRSLAYYDRPGAPARDGVDDRPRDEAPSESHLRRDPLTGEWAIIAGHRQERTFQPTAQETRAQGCPLCPSTPDHATEIPAEDYQVVVFDNRFPSLTRTAAGMETPDERPGIGRCQVVCFTDDHDARLANLDADRVLLIVQAWADSVARLREDPRLISCLVFENRGAEIGVTLTHPHGQVYAYPFLPPREGLLLDAAARHHAETGRTLALDLAADEERDAVRLLAATDHWTAHVPRAARWPFEVRITPRRAIASLDGLHADEAADFAALYPRLLRALDDVYGVPMPYVAAWHQAPLAGGAPGAQLFLEVLSSRRAPDKLKYPAGSESAAGVWINDIAPERAAAMLREALA